MRMLERKLTSLEGEDDEIMDEETCCIEAVNEKPKENGAFEVDLGEGMSIVNFNYLAPKAQRELRSVACSKATCSKTKGQKKPRQSSSIEQVNIQILWYFVHTPRGQKLGSNPSPPPPPPFLASRLTIFDTDKVRLCLVCICFFSILET